MKLTLYTLILAALLFVNAAAQSDEQYQTSVTRFQKQRERILKTPEETPLKKKALGGFNSLPFFAVNPDYRVKASFTPITEKPLELPTFYGNGDLPFVQRGTLEFALNGKNYLLNVYQRVPGVKGKKMFSESYYFVPFRDATNGAETFEGGRYIDLSKSATEVVTLDFNYAYTPDCAYNKRFICPIPPTENRLETRVEAGEKVYVQGLHRKPKK